VTPTDGVRPSQDGPPIYRPANQAPVAFLDLIAAGPDGIGGVVERFAESADAQVNPPVGPSAVRTTTLKLENPPRTDGRMQVTIWASLPSMAQTTHRIGKEAAFLPTHPRPLGQLRAGSPPCHHSNYGMNFRRCGP